MSSVVVLYLFCIASGSVKGIWYMPDIVMAHTSMERLPPAVQNAVLQAKENILGFEFCPENRPQKSLRPIGCQYSEKTGVATARNS
ncbi:hypothetical protein EYF80_042930 [Liparis tanakae]|uniref:Uncharacterized protein n=1 Tax=Liparis tanakae TaxID=230148 RepID=A0A4Z2G200_9TELE|nr:hypothetical protein EYF80_042930 [Liparis tanakae]